MKSRSLRREAGNRFHFTGIRYNIDGAKMSKKKETGEDRRVYEAKFTGDVYQEKGEFLKSLCSLPRKGEWWPDSFIAFESLMALEMTGGDMGFVGETEESRWRIEEYFECGGEACRENRSGEIVEDIETV